MTEETEEFVEDICPKCGTRSAHLFGYVNDLEGKNDHYFCNLCQIGWLVDDPNKIQIPATKF